MRVGRTWLLSVGAAAAIALAGCGSSSSSPSSGSGGGGSSSSPVSATGPTSGPGLTEPTAPSGSKVAGGTVFFTEGSDATPNYIFPMYSPQVCSTTNANQLMFMMYRPLYWFGNNYRPTVDYDYSIGQQPQFTSDNKVVTVKLNPGWKWSNGESVTSRDVVFWMNVLKADPATEWCGYVPGYFPDNVTSYSAPDPSTVVFHLKKSYNPTYFLYNGLAQITPLPLAWDRTSLSQPAPKSDNGHLPDSTKAGAAAVYKFLDSEAKKLGSWASSPLWSVVDGPFKLQDFTSNGQVTLVPNPSYSGSPKATISKLVELPFTSETAIYNQIRSGGPSALTVANLPSQYGPQASTLEAQGYTINKAASYSFNYFPLNFNSNAPTSPGGQPIRFIFRQPYFRQAIQHLIDQPGWIRAFLNNDANPTYGPIPLSPPSPLVDAGAIGTNPYPFSVSAASQLLSSHGWKVQPGGTTTCQNPSLCGTGISSGEGISFNIDYQSGVVAVQDEMNDLAAHMKKLGINVNLTTHPFSTVISTATACTPNQPACKWTAENWGAGWIYGPADLPTGEPLFYPGAVANYGNYSDPQATKLINSTIFGSTTAESQALVDYDKYMEQSLPVVFGPTSIGTYQGDAGTLVDKNLGGYAANALGWMTPENWYFTK